MLEEAYHLLGLETKDIDIYKLSQEQKKAIKESREQIKNGQFLTNDQASKDIDEWLSK